MFRSIDACCFSTTYGTHQMYGFDRQVGLGVLGKGRSASFWLNEECRRVLPIVLGRRHYPGYGLPPTRLNPADHPTRSRLISPLNKHHATLSPLFGGTPLSLTSGLRCRVRRTPLRARLASTFGFSGRGSSSTGRQPGREAVRELGPAFAQTGFAVYLGFSCASAFRTSVFNTCLGFRATALEVGKFSLCRTVLPSHLIKAG